MNQSPINNENGKSVKLSEEDYLDADLLALDSEVIRRLVQIIFAQEDPDAPVS